MESWVCPCCTAHNNAASAACEVCSSIRGLQIRSETRASIIACALCTAHNATTNEACELCGSLLPRVNERGITGTSMAAKLARIVAKDAQVRGRAASEAVEIVRALQASIEREERDRAVAAALADEEAARALDKQFKREAEEAKGRAAAETLHAEHLANLEAPCALCLSEARIRDMFTLDCTEGHRFCFDCIKRQVCVWMRQRLQICPKTTPFTYHIGASGSR